LLDQPKLSQVESQRLRTLPPGVVQVNELR
jgi:hypothetical protein